MSPTCSIPIRMARRARCCTPRGGSSTTTAPPGYGSHLKVGEASDALFGPGLLDARAAEVILVLRSQISELVSEMLRTFTLIQAGDGATTRLRGRSAQLLPSKCAG